MSCGSSDHGATEAGSGESWWTTALTEGGTERGAMIMEAVAGLWCAYWIPICVFGAVVLLCHLGIIRPSETGGYRGPSGSGYGGDFGGDAGGDC